MKPVLAAALLAALCAAAPTAPAAPAAPQAPEAPAAAALPPSPASPPAEALPGSAAASDRPAQLKGNWPAASPRVTVNLERLPTREAIQRLAEAAHWSVVFKDRPRGKVDASFNDVPADQALLAILKDQELMATRQGDLITISDFDQAEDSEDAGPASAAAGSTGDRVRVGSSVHVAEGETVKSAVSVGGDVVVDGTVLKDAVSVGGTVKLGPKAVVRHDAVAVGGSLQIAPAAKVEGSRVSMGLGGISVSDKHGGPNDRADLQIGQGAEPEPTGVKGFLLGLGRSLAQFALLFVLGLLLLTFVPERIKSIGREVRRAPVQAGMVGLVGMLLLVPLTVLLVVTIIGIIAIPFLYFGLGVALLLGFTALAVEVGAWIPPRSSKRTQVLLLAVGSLALFLVSQIPVLGALVMFCVLMASLGAALRTRLGAAHVDANFAPEP